MYPYWLYCIAKNLTVNPRIGRLTPRRPERGKRARREGTRAYLPKEAVRRKRCGCEFEPLAAFRGFGIPVLCRGGIRYLLLRVRGRRLVNSASSGRWIPPMPAVKSVRFSPYCASYMALSVRRGKRRIFGTKSRKGRRLLRMKCPAPRYSPPMLVRSSQLHSRSEPDCQGRPCAVGLQELWMREGPKAMMGMVLW